LSTSVIRLALLKLGQSSSHVFVVGCALPAVKENGYDFPERLSAGFGSGFGHRWRFGIWQLV
jgi:hypothetical protein